MQQIYAIGETILDIIFRDQQPRVARPGGSSFNASITLGRLNAPITFISEMGADRVGDLIKEFMEKNMNILILFKRNMMNIQYKHPLFELLKENGLNWVDLNEWGQRSNSILVGTLYGMKGLEADAVFIPELDLYHSSEHRQLLYVGMTRALKCLILTASKPTKFVSFLHKVHDRI